MQRNRCSPELTDGRRVLRIEGLQADNGPDLFVYLSANPANGDEGAFDDGHVNLGSLKGNQGDQNYYIPRDADLDRLPTVVIWCDRLARAAFTRRVAFGRWEEALDRRPDDVKIVLDVTAP